MTITFESDKDVIVYALEKIISYARDNQYIFLAQSVWWISSIIGLQQGLILHIDNLMIRSEVGITAPESSSVIHPDRLAKIQKSDDSYNTSDGDSVSTTETDIHNEVIDNCEALLAQSKQERKSIGRVTRDVSRAVKKKTANRKQRNLKTFGTQTKGIEGSELRRRKAAGECQRCACPSGLRTSHKTIDCLREIKYKKGTATQ
jgi:hypothetical protein